jgi:hypothetical protein
MFDPSRLGVEEVGDTALLVEWRMKQREGAQHIPWDVEL